MDLSIIFWCLFPIIMQFKTIYTTEKKQNQYFQTENLSKNIETEDPVLLAVIPTSTFR